MRVEIAVELGQTRREPKAEKHKSHAPQIPRVRDRQLRWLALALHIEDLVQNGKVANLAAVARMCGVSRARVSMVVGMLGLPISEQLTILGLSSPKQGTRSIKPSRGIGSICLDVRNTAGQNTITDRVTDS